MELDKFVTQGDDLINNLNEKLENQISKDQNKLLEKVLGEFLDKFR